jgi:hypothetical protein
MTNEIQTGAARLALTVSLFAGGAGSAYADAINDWNVKAGEFIVAAKLGTPPAIRAMAIVQTAVHGAVNGITEQHPTAVPQAQAARGASIDAAVAAANRVTLGKLLPSQQAGVDAAYQAALTKIGDGPAKSAGIDVGERAAAAVLAQRADDGTAAPEAYRPRASAGTYVPTTAPAVPQWAQRRPWLMTGASQFRPGSPPALTSVVWTRDYDEVKAFGARTSTQRNAGQTDIARFWEYSLPSIYYGVVRSVAQQPGREVTDNARLFAAVAQAMDDAMISVFEAKYHYNFWRPSTAIRNGDIDGNEATERDAGWVSLIDAPMHPEYPSGHAILAAAVGAVLQADVGGEPMPLLTTVSPTAKGAARQWTSVDDFVREVADSRIYAGIHYRTSVDVGAAMGRQIGELAAQKLLQAPY